jgi:hypothetical protein
MLGSSTLEVAIGVIFLYLLLSLLCTAINEGIASLLNKRGKNLFEGIKNLLNDPLFTGLAQQLYTHGLVNGISQNATNPEKPNRLPSYMSANTFALALIDILGSRGVGESWQDVIQQRHKELSMAQAASAAHPGNTELQQVVQDAQAAFDKAQADHKLAAAAKEAHTAAETAAQQVTGLKDLSKLNAASALLETALAAGRALAADHPDPLGNIRKAVEGLPQGHTKESLLVLVDKTKREASHVAQQITTAAQQVDHLRENLEHWFESATSRFGGWYKRWTQRVVLLIALLLVVLANADTLMLVKRLTRDEALRASLVTAADKASRNPTGSSAENTTARQDLLAQAEKLQLPLGWSPAQDDPYHTDQVPNDFLGWVLKCVGLLMSVLAASLGAPFWFDTLSKFVNLRGAGTPPGETKKSAPQPTTT